MIRRATSKQPDSIRENEILGENNKLGPITDVFFDELSWNIRYLVIRVEDDPEGREALIHPGLVSGIDRQARTLYADTNTQALRQANQATATPTTTASHEDEHRKYLNLDPYWSQDPAPPAPVPKPSIESGDGAIRHSEAEPNLRSARDIVRYDVETADVSAGHVKDLLLDDESWKIRYLVVDTSNWLPAKNVLLPVECVSKIQWPFRQILVNPGEQEIEDAPAWDPRVPLDHDYETRLRVHYGHPSRRIQD